jgi:hypothetical protein
MTNSCVADALEFQPVRRAAAVILRVSQFGDYPFVTVLAGGLIFGYAVFDAVWGVA